MAIVTDVGITVTVTSTAANVVATAALPVGHTGINCYEATQEFIAEMVRLAASKHLIILTGHNTRK